MARAGTPKVNRHVTYYDAACKPRPATITGVTSTSVVDVRVLHTGETHLAITRQVTGKAANTWKQN